MSLGERQDSASHRVKRQGMNRKRIVAAMLSVLAFALTHGLASVSKQTPPPSPPRYTVTNLGTLPGGDQSGAYGINNAGQVVGWSDSGATEPPDASSFSRTIFIHNHAVLWNHGQPHDLGLLKGFPFSSARAINNRGQIIGGWESRTLPGYGDDGIYRRQVFLWQKGRMTISSNDLPPYCQDFTAINDNGVVVGDGSLDNHGPIQPTLWRNGQISDLGLLPGATYGGKSEGINKAGDVVGWVRGPASNGINADYCAFLWRNGQMINLDGVPIGPGDGGAHFSQAFAINDTGEVVGEAGDACLWQDGKRQRLYSSNAPDLECMTAYAVNNHGQVVGAGFNAARRREMAFLYDGVPHDLNDLIPPNSGWILQDARGINDRGQIVGSGTHEGKDHAFLLTPVKSP